MQFLGKEAVPIYGWTDGVPVDDKALGQLRNVARMPFIHHHVAVMPDCHWGMGCTIGSVVPTVGAIIPACVGVDLGCGMMAYRTGLTANDLPDNLLEIRSHIEAAVPHGRTDNGGANDKGAFPDNRDKNLPDDLRTRLDIIVAKRYTELHKAAYKAPYQLGTLGTGNHFIELCLDENSDVWVMLHSGSRGIGNKIASVYIDLAKKDMRRWFINLPDEDLAYFPEGSVLFDDYIEGMQWGQDFALANRQKMMGAVLGILRQHFGDRVKPETGEMAVQCHHNYVTKEKHYGKNVWLTRKGAVQAREGTLGIIPGSMGVKSFIVRGKGNHESFHSCSHGAGRVMSRNEAIKSITIEDHIHDTAGVECKKDASVIDESPKAYKDIVAVMKAQEDLVEIVHTLKQCLCIKG